MHSCVIFDLDGTLIDSRMDLADAVNFMREQFSLEALPSAEIIKFVGNGARMLVTRALTNTDINVDKALPLMTNYYLDNALNKTVLYPGVYAGLQELHNAGIPMAVITNKPLTATEKILNAFDIKQYLSMIIGGDSNFPLKPDPESLLYFVNKISADAGKSWMLGDHYTDLEAARRAGMQRCFASYGFGDCRNETFEFSVECFTDFVNLCLGSYKH